MDIRKILFNVVGVALGGGVMYALVKKSGLEKQARTLSATIVEGSAITGGALLGYHLSNFAASRLFSENVEKLPQQQVESLPTGEKPVETPTSMAAMGNVAAKAKAVTPVANANDIGNNVIDITKNVVQEN